MSRRKTYAALRLFFFFSAALYAQEKTETGPKFIQRLSWDKEEYALFYEVQVEKRAAENGTGTYTETIREKTERDFIEISLPAGLYRYRVLAFDFFEEASENPEWIYFEVLAAFQPELYFFDPKEAFMDSPESLTLSVGGRNLEADTAFYLSPRGRGENILPFRYVRDQAGEKAGLVFTREQLKPGTYDIVAVNPGGLSARLGTFTVHPVSRNFSVQAGYAPLVPVYGELNSMLEAKIFPAAAYAKISFMIFRGDFGAFGLEAAPYWNYLSSKYHAPGFDYDVTAQILGARIYGLFRRPLFDEKFALNVRAGGGVFYFVNFRKQAAGNNPDPVNVLHPSAEAGLSLQWNFSTSFFVEFGLEYIHLFSVDKPPPGYILPFAGLGWRL